MEQGTERRTVVVTGASDGIGAAAARQLAERGHDVVVVGRSPRKTEGVARALGAPHFTADFARFDDVRRLAEQLRSARPRIDVLANNAGGIFGRHERTPDGFERTLQVNHLSPFLLTHLLLDPLLAGGGAVVNTSSVAARIGRPGLPGHGRDRTWSAHRAYGDAKLANILFAKELTRRYGDRGLAAAAFHPGGVATNFASAASPPLRAVYRSRLGRSLMTTPDRGAETLVWLAEGAPGRDWEPGGYYERRRPARTSRLADDAALAEALWSRSAELVGLDPSGPG